MASCSMTAQCRAAAPRFTIATLVNDAADHRAMVASFAAAGFTGADCEFLAVDNTGARQTSAYLGLNRMLDAARAPYVILCHQDVRLLDDGLAELEQRLTELEELDPTWALAGNAGGIRPGAIAIRISDPHGCDRRVGIFPQRVTSLDENFMVVKRGARIGFSRDLDGFHHYGADICLAADIMGYAAYVIDFHLAHRSAGRKDESFRRSEDAFRAKWAHALRARWIQTTCSLVGVSGNAAGRLLADLASAPLAALSRRLPSAVGWTGRRS